MESKKMIACAAIVLVGCVPPARRECYDNAKQAYWATLKQCKDEGLSYDLCEDQYGVERRHRLAQERCP